MAKEAREAARKTEAEEMRRKDNIWCWRWDWRLARTETETQARTRASVGQQPSSSPSAMASTRIIFHAASKRIAYS